MKPILLSKNLKNKKMLTKENLKLAGTVLVVTMIALAVHQKFVAPMLVKKAVVAK